MSAPSRALRMRIEVVQGDITTLNVDAIDTIGQWLAAKPLPERVLLCAFNESMASLYRNRLPH